MYFGLLERSDRLESELVSSLLNQRTQAPRRDHTPVVPIFVGTKVVEAERQLAMRTLDAYSGDRQAAAKALGIPLDRLSELLDEGLTHSAVPSA